jgi:hypothetical protein
VFAAFYLKFLKRPWDDSPDARTATCAQVSKYSPSSRLSKKNDRVGVEYCDAVCDLGVFVDQAAEPIPPGNAYVRHGCG